MAADRALLDLVRAGLRAAAEPDRAPGMQAYMRSSMPYLGVRVPRVRAVTRTAAAQHPPAGPAVLTDTVRALWHEATHREERYAATALLAVPAAVALRGPGLLGLHRELIVDGAWWDHVDELAHRVGELLLGWPAEVRAPVREWAQQPDRWLRRAAIVCQLGLRERTDVALLSEAIEAAAAEPDVFLRKAIGWALRDHARTDPRWVRDFVAAHELSPLSVREATKHL